MSRSTVPPPALRAGSRPDFAGLFAFHYILHLLLTLFPLALCLGFFLLVAPKFQEIFKDFRTTLPLFTQYTMALAYYVRSGLWVVIVLGGLTLPLLSAWISSRQPTRRDRAMWAFFVFNIMFLLTLLGVILGGLALYLPLIKLIQSVSGGEQDRG